MLTDSSFWCCVGFTALLKGGLFLANDYYTWPKPRSWDTTITWTSLFAETPLKCIVSDAFLQRKRIMSVAEMPKKFLVSVAETYQTQCISDVILQAHTPLWSAMPFACKLVAEHNLYLPFIPIRHWTPLSTNHRHIKLIRECHYGSIVNDDPRDYPSIHVTSRSLAPVVQQDIFNNKKTFYLWREASTSSTKRWRRWSSSSRDNNLFLKVLKRRVV